MRVFNRCWAEDAKTKWPLCSLTAVCTFLVFRWEELISLANEREELLQGAKQVHKFVRDASETNDRMNEKVSKIFLPEKEIEVTRSSSRQNYFLPTD